MTVTDIYERLCERIPEELRESWDNDGIMCLPDDTKDVKRVLISLDITEEIVDYAESGSFDLIISHHPLIFNPVSSLSLENNVARKLIKLTRAGIAAISLHTRADKVRGGVNDCLAKRLGLLDIEVIGDDGLCRMGHLEAETDVESFIFAAKSSLGARCAIVADAYNPVYTVAVVGGSGKDYIKEALLSGADTFVSGSIGYNAMEEAAELGINMIELGHYETEFPVCQFFSRLISKMDSRIDVEIVGSNMISVM